MNLSATVSSLMTSNLITVSPEDKLVAVKELFETHNIHHLPVIEYGQLVGMLSKADYLYFMQPHRKKTSFTNGEEDPTENYLVQDAMIKRVMSISSQATIHAALEVLTDNKFHALPVIDHGELVGILTTHDILFRLLHPVKATS